MADMRNVFINIVIVNIQGSSMIRGGKMSLLKKKFNQVVTELKCPA